LPQAACDGARRDGHPGPSGRQPSTPAIPRHQRRCRETPARIAEARDREAMPRCPRSPRSRSLPRGVMVRRIVGARESSARLVAARGRRAHHPAKPGWTALLVVSATPSRDADPVLGQRRLWSTAAVWGRAGERRLLAHQVDPTIDRHGRYRRITGPPCDIGKSGGPPLGTNLVTQAPPRAPSRLERRPNTVRYSRSPTR
jgi:hypothetical protein